MEQLITSGWIADIILVVIAAETLIIAFYFWRKGLPMALISFAASGLAGGSLVLALRAVMRDSGWIYVAAYLFAALLAHLADVVLRLLAQGKAEKTALND